MSGRFMLSCFLVCVPVAAFAQRSEDDPTPPKPPQQLVVTLGSKALMRYGSPCKAVGFSPDSNSVHVFSQTGVERWDIATGKAIVQTLFENIEHNDHFYPTTDGRQVLIAGRNEKRSMRLIEVATRKLTQSTEYSQFHHIQPADDGRVLAVGSGPNTQIVWLNKTMDAIELPKIADVRRLAVATDAKVFALIADDRVSVHTATGLWKLELPKDTVYTSVALTADGKQLATASARETDDGKRPGPIDLWDVTTRTKLRTMAAVEWFSEAPFRLRFTPDGKTLVAGDGAYLRGWNTANGAKTFAVEPGWGWVGNIQISPNGKYAAVAYSTRPMVYELATGRQPPALHGHSGPVWDIAVSPDGTRAATAMYARSAVNLWDTSTGQNLGEVHAFYAKPIDGSRVVPGRVRTRFSRDGRTILTVNEASRNDGPIRLWDANTLGLLREISVPGGDSPSAAFTRNGLFAILDRTPTLLDTNSGKPLWTKPRVPPGAKVAVSVRGDRIAVEGRDHTSILEAFAGAELDRASGEPIRFTLDGTGLISEGKKHSAMFRDLMAKKDGPTILNAPDAELFATSETGLVAMVHGETNPVEYRVYLGRNGVQLSTCEPWATNGGGLLPPLPRAGGWHKMVFSPDGRTLALVGTDVQCFESYSGQRIFEVFAEGEARAMAFTPDGRRLFTSHGTEETGSQVNGWDTTGGASRAAAPALDAELEGLKITLGSKPEAARAAMYRLATRPTEAVAFAKEVTTLATEADYANYKKWLGELDAPAFATRESAMKALAKAGWRAEGLMRQLLEKTESVESRERLEKLLAKRDMRPLRAVHLLEVIGTPDAVAVLKQIATGPAESLVVQDAKWSLLRLMK